MVFYRDILIFQKSSAVDGELSTPVKIGAAATAGRTLGRIPVRVEDVYTDSEEEDSHGTLVKLLTNS